MPRQNLCLADAVTVADLLDVEVAEAVVVEGVEFVSVGLFCVWFAQEWVVAALSESVEEHLYGACADVRV